jgi:integrase
MCAPGLPVLDWRDVDLDKLELHVHADVARKKGYDRITPIQPNLAAWLKQYRKSQRPHL